VTGRDAAGPVAVAVAVVLSASVAGLLAAVWLADGYVRRRGPAVLLAVPVGSHVPGLGWCRLLPVLATVAVLVAGRAAVPVGWRWPARTSDLDSGSSRRARRVRRVRRARRDGRAGSAGWAGRAAGWHAVAAAAGVAAAVRLDGRATPAVTAVTVLLFAGAVCWRLVGLQRRALRPYRPGGRARPAALAAPVVVLVVAAALAGVGSGWWFEGRHVRASTTAQAAPPGGDTGPVQPGAVRWQHRVEDAAHQDAYLLGGGYAVVVEGPAPVRQVSVLDAATGRVRWFYRHDDADLVVWMEPVSGVLLVQADRDQVQWLHAFDLRTGHSLWNRRDSGHPLDNRLPPTIGQRMLPAGLLVLSDLGRLRGLDLRTGAPRWQRAADPTCVATSDVLRAGDVLLLASLCRSTRLTALRADTGALAWTAPISATPVNLLESPRPVLVAGGVAVVQFTPPGTGEVATDSLIGVDVRSGRVLWRRSIRTALHSMEVLGGRFAALAVPTRPATPADPLPLDLLRLDPGTGQTVRSTPVPPATAETNTLLAAASDGARFYLLDAPATAGPGPIRLTVLDADGGLLGRAAFDRCTSRCRPGQVTTPDVGGLRADGGTLLLLTRGDPAIVTAIGDGGAFRPAP
jgi:outer membrane protein assembly factor BamB